MMAVRPMLIPKDLITQAETKVVEVRTIKDGEAHIRKILAQHPFEKDQFYFRKGII
jgi:hypothetical protein